MAPQGAATSREERKVENKEVRILVVDDEPMMADSLRKNFADQCFFLALPRNFRDALRPCTCPHPCAVKAVAFAPPDPVEPDER